MNFNYKNFRIEKAPPSVYYIPNFITNEEEYELIKRIYATPKPKWTCLSNRRLQDYGGVPHPKGMITESIPNWLQTYMHRIDALQPFHDDDQKRTNHVLINEYKPGQGIMPHTDGPLFYPTVTTISCGSHTVLEFEPNEIDNKNVGGNFSLLLERCSLLILQDDLYKNYKHSIREQTEDTITGNVVNLNNRFEIGNCLERQTRLSITIRHVPKVAKIKLFH